MRQHGVARRLAVALRQRLEGVPELSPHLIEKLFLLSEILERALQRCFGRRAAGLLFLSAHLYSAQLAAQTFDLLAQFRRRTLRCRAPCGLLLEATLESRACVRRGCQPADSRAAQRAESSNEQYGGVHGQFRMGEDRAKNTERL